MEGNYTETIIFRTTKEQKRFIQNELKKLESDFGEGFRFTESDVIRRALYKSAKVN